MPPHLKGLLVFFCDFAFWREQKVFKKLTFLTSVPPPGFLGERYGSCSFVCSACMQCPVDRGRMLLDVVGDPGAICRVLLRSEIQHGFVEGEELV
jgi:hypothetical protein